VFGFINPLSGKSHFQYIKRLNADCFLRFLKAVLKEYPDASKIHIIVDNAPAHRANKIERFESNVERLNLIKLPPYSPDLNPIETVWREVKKAAVYNTFYRFFDEFKESLTHHLRNFEGSKVKNICNVEKYVSSAS
jgi:putative transposase